MASRRSKSLGRDTSKKVFAFGSSTPRELSYLNLLPHQYRVYDFKTPTRRSRRDKSLQDYLKDARTGSPGRPVEIRPGEGPIYAFGSRTPRAFLYLEHICPEMRVYDVMLTSSDAINGRSKTTAFTTGKQSKLQNPYFGKFSYFWVLDSSFFVVVSMWNFRLAQCLVLFGGKNVVEVSWEFNLEKKPEKKIFQNGFFIVASSFLCFQLWRDIVAQTYRSSFVNQVLTRCFRFAPHRSLDQTFVSSF